MSEAVLKAKLTLHDGQFTAGMRKAVATATHAGHEIGAKLKESVTGPLVEIGAALAGAFAAERFAESTKGAYELGSRLVDLSRRTGMAAGTALVMSQAFKDTGSSADAVGPAINKMQKALAGANEDGFETSSAFSQLGLNMKALRAMSPDQQFQAVGAAIKQLRTEAQRTEYAMKIFGKSGAELRGVLENPQAFGAAARALGSQAEILNKNSESFKEIADSLGHVGTKLQGFFVGFADSFQSAIKPLLDRMEKIDLATMGERFGNGLKTGAAFFIGSFSNLDLMRQAIEANGLAGFRTVMNFATAALEQFPGRILNLLAGIGLGFQSLGYTLLSSLVRAMGGAIAYFQANIEAGLNKLRDGMAGIDTSPVSDGDKKFIATMDERIAKLKVELGIQKQIADLNNNPKGAAVRAEALAKMAKVEAELAGDISLRGTTQTKINNASQYDPEAIQKAIMAAGGPKAATSSGEKSADDLQKMGEDEFAEAMKGLGKTFNEFTVSDRFNAAAAKASADKLNQNIVNLGNTISNNTTAITGGKEGASSEGDKKTIDPNESPILPWQQRDSGEIPLSERVKPTGLINYPDVTLPADQGASMLNQGIAGQTGKRTVDSALSFKDRQDLQDALVAQGGTRLPSNPEAYHAVRSGDARRRKAVVAENEKAAATATVMDTKITKISDIMEQWNKGK